MVIRRGFTLFIEDKELVIYQALMDPIKPNLILKACISGMKKLKSYGN